MSLDVESLARRAAREADEAEVFADEERSLNASSESGVFSEVAEGSELGFGVRVIRKGKAGFSFGNNPDKFDAVVKKAVEMSKIGTNLPRLPPAEARYRKIRAAFDARIENLEGRDLLSRLKQMVDAMRLGSARPTYAGIGVSVSTATIANSNGVYSSFSSTEIGGGAYASAEESVGFESRESRRDNLDFQQFGQTAAERAVAGMNPQKIESVRKAAILLEPDAVAGLLGNTLLPAIDGENVFRKNSKLGGKLGRKIFSASFGMSDDGLLPGGLGSFPADGEGLPCRRTPIIAGGVLKNFLYNWETALRAGAKPTGNGFRSFSSRPAISPTNLVVSPGKSKESRLIEKVGGGFMVRWLSGTHTTNPFSGEFSVEMKNAFRVEKGRVAAPVKYGLISGNIFDVLAGRIEAARDGIETISPFVTPPVIIEADVVA